MEVKPEDAFSILPEKLARDLLSSYERVVTNFAEHRWEPSELNGGKLCEAAYSTVHGYLSGKFPPKSIKPRNMVDACTKLASEFPGPRSARIQIPRMIVALYEIRNNRGVGHVGGEVSPNQMDATAVLYMSKWILAELVRLLHEVSPEYANDIVEQLIQRTVPLVWISGQQRRVLVNGLTLKEQTLILLTGVQSAHEQELHKWLDLKTSKNYRSRILQPMHCERLIEFNDATGEVMLLPPGLTHAETLIRKNQIART